MFTPCSFDKIFINKKYLEQNSRETDHFLQEILRVAKIMLDRGASEYTELTPSPY